MEHDTIEQWLEGITYRPGWSVRYAGELSGGRRYVTVYATEPDVCNPGETFTTSPLFLVPENITQRQFYDWLLDVCIPGIEAHERYEWFRIHGQHWRDPHAPGMPAFATEFSA